MQRSTPYSSAAAGPSAAPRESEASEFVTKEFLYAGHFSEDLRRTLLAAYQRVKGRNDLRIGRHNLLLALLEQPRIRAHVFVSERDIDKLSSLIHQHIQVASPKEASSAAGASQTLSWEPALREILDRANVLHVHYGLPSIDIGLVFDLLRYDEHLKGIFHFSESGTQDHHDARIDQIKDYFVKAQDKYDSLESKIGALTEGGQRLSSETDRQKGELTDVSARNTNNTRQHADLATKFAALDNKVTGLSLEMSKLQGTLQTVLGLLERATRIGSPYGYGAPDPRYPSSGPGAYPADPRTTAPMGTYPNTSYPPAPPAGGQAGAMPFHGSQTQQPEPYPQDPRLRTEPYQPAPRTAPVPPPPDVPVPEPTAANSKGGLFSWFAGKQKDEPRAAAPQPSAGYPLAAEPQRYPVAPSAPAHHAAHPSQPVAGVPQVYPSPSGQPAPAPSTPTSPAPAAAAPPRQVASLQPAPAATLPRATAEPAPAARPNGLHPAVKAAVVAPPSAQPSSAAVAAAPRTAAVPMPANDPGNRSKI